MLANDFRQTMATTFVVPTIHLLKPLRSAEAIVRSPELTGLLAIPVAS